MKTYKKYWAIESGEQWEPTTTHFITSNKAHADWLVGEYNKCNSNWETWYVSEWKRPPALKIKISLKFGFTFYPNDTCGVPMDSVTSSTDLFGEGETGYDEYAAAVCVNGTGHSYEECLTHAHQKAVKAYHEWLHDL